MIDFLWGAIATACLAIGVRFLSFWLESRDRFFLLFALAFWALAGNWILVEVLHPQDEVRHFLVYLLRLLAFVLILVAIVDKNVKRKAG